MPNTTFNDLGTLTIEWCRDPDGSVLATCPQLPGFRYGSQSAQNLSSALANELARYLARTLEMAAIVRPCTNVLQFQLYEPGSTTSIAASSQAQ